MSKITRITKIYPVQFNKNKPKNANTSFSNILKKMIKAETADNTVNNTVNNQSQVCYIHSDEINNSQMLLNNYEYKTCINTLYQKYNRLILS